MSNKLIVVVGSINIDFVAHVARVPACGETLFGRDFSTNPGGKGSNQAAAVGRLGYPVAMIGCVGPDVFGEQSRQSLAAAGVDTSAIVQSEEPTGTAMIMVQTDGNNSIVVLPGANASLGPYGLDRHINLLRGASMVLAQLETPLATIEHLVAICGSEGIPLMLDPAPARELPASVWRGVTWLTPNETEARSLCGWTDAQESDPVALIQALRARGARNIALKLGELGAYLGMEDGLCAHVPPFAVQAVDTTAAGDAFNGAFAAALVRGEHPRQAARFATAAAAVSVTRRGALPSMPTHMDVTSLLEQNLIHTQELIG